MNILYVTGLSIPLKNIIEGKMEKEITGLPGFYYPWKKLVDRGHNVDFVFISNFKGKYNIKVQWFSEKNILANIYAPYTEVNFFRFIRQFIRFIQLLYYTYKATKTKKYDFIYCKAYEGFAGQIIGKIYKIPTGIRLFGDFTFCYTDIKKYGIFWGSIKHIFEFFSFKLGANFLLATDDGSNCDKLFYLWNNYKTKFYFWKTGIDISLPEINKPSTIRIPNKNYIYFAARYQNWKRHDRVINVLKKLIDKNYKLDLVFTGNITSQEYYESLKKLSKYLNVDQYVFFEKEIAQNDVKLLAKNAVANILMADNSNLGNVFFEIFSIGSIIISLKNRALEEYIVNGYNGFLVENEDEVVEIIIKILKEEIDSNKIKENAKKTALERFLSIDERFDKEVELIERTARREKNIKIKLSKK
ncbi:MAG: glycosyltransferase [candidate division WOR-3 bacterium]